VSAVVAPDVERQVVVPPNSPWQRFFFAPQSTAPMTLLRVGWGAVTAAWALSFLPDVDPFLTEGALSYERDLPPGAWNPLGRIGWDHAALATCLVLLVASLATMVGAKTRLSAAVAVLCLTCLQRGNTTIFNSGDLLLRQLGIAVLLAPSATLWSVDAVRARRRGRPATLLRAPWAMRLLQLELALGYLLSAWTKARGDTWHDGTAIALSLRIEDLQRFVAPEWLFDQSVLLNLFTWGALAFEATFIMLIWPTRLRLPVLAAGVLFHLGIEVFLDIGFFSLAIFLAYLAFLPTELADKWVARFDKRARADDERPPGTEDQSPGMPRWRRWGEGEREGDRVHPPTPTTDGDPGDPASPAGSRPPSGRDGGGDQLRS